MSVIDLKRETEAAKSLLASLAGILGDDAELIANTVEGETDLHRELELAVARIVEIDGMVDAIVAMKKTLTARESRLDAQRETLRTAVGVAMEIAGMKRLEMPLGTVTLKNVPPKLVVVSEEDIPARFWQPSDPRLNKKAILDELKEKLPVAGCTLSNGSTTIQVRTS